ncbi:MAG: prepilin peptidase, partial [Planctomycetota bacterium]|nr:prepilin peptidase [Planctomycetota bacterium]
MLSELPFGFWIAWWALTGLVLGSFLNVCIHRLPRDGMTVGHPRRSRCPGCGHELSWRENVPLVSWLVQRGRCTACGWRIPWRYPLVEALTSGLFALSLWQAPDWRLGIVWSVVLAGLIVATFVDLEWFEIPDEVSIGGIVLAPICALLVPELHADTWVAGYFSETDEVNRFGALMGSAAGILIGGGVLMAIGALGRRAFGEEAMGFGDVKLLAAGGGFIGPGGVLVAVFVASLLGSLFGVAEILRTLCLLRRRARARRTERSFARSVRAARVAGRMIPFGPYLGIGIGIALLAWDHVLRLL